MQLSFARLDDYLLCALKICDDGNDGAILWSIVERDEELEGIRGLARGEPLTAFLFNELAVNVAWNLVGTPRVLDRLSMWSNNVMLAPVDHSALYAAATNLLERLHHLDESDDDWVVLEVGGRSDWKPVHNHFITTNASASLIDLFDRNEGGQQEQISIWLTDNLQPSGVFHSPQIPKGRGTRELTDLLLSHEFGSALIESKTLSIFARQRLPNREKLERDISGDIDKAFNQLCGAIKTLKSNVSITDSCGNILAVERKQPAHAIVLIPDLDLVKDHAIYGTKFISDFVRTTGGIPHLLDISELLRIVQAAQMIAARGETTTPMMAFDYYLMQRAEKAVKAGTLCIEVLLRFTDKSSTEN